MKSERRKELKENELIHSLMDLGQTLQRYAPHLVVGVVVVAAVLGFGYYSKASKAARVNAQWEELTQLMRNMTTDETLQKLRMIVNEQTDKSVVLPANQLLAGALLAQAAHRDEGTDPADTAARLNEAEQAYRRMLAIPGVPAVYRGGAMLGLAQIAEQRRDWDAARAQYQAIIDDKELSLLAFAQTADAALKQLEDLTEPVVFAEAPDEPPPADTRPVEMGVPSIEPLPLPAPEASDTEASQETSATQPTED